MNGQSNIVSGYPFRLLVCVMLCCVVIPPVAVGEDEAIPGNRLAKLVLVKNQTSNTGVSVHSQGTIKLFAERRGGPPERFTGMGESTMRISGTVRMTQSIREVLAGKVAHNASSVSPALVITRWQRNGVLVDLPKQGYKIPLLHGGRVNTRTTVKTRGMLMECESSVEIEVEDDCAAMEAIVHLVECLLDEYSRNRPDQGESWEDYNQRIQESLQETLAADEALTADELQVVPLVGDVSATATSKVSVHLGPCAPFLIDLHNPGDLLGDMPALNVDSLELHHPSIDMPAAAWEAVAETWGELNNEGFWESAGGIEDANNGRIHEQTYLEELLKKLQEKMEEVCG